MTKFQLITKGLIKENPTFVLLLGMCPTLATTTSAINGMTCYDVRPRAVQYGYFRGRKSDS